MNAGGSRGLEVEQRFTADRRIQNNLIEVGVSLQFDFQATSTF